MSSQNGISESLRPIRLRLPATSANLGPGFDALGLALSLYLTIEAEQAETFQIHATGRDAELCGSISNNLILMTYSEVLEHHGLVAPKIRLKLHNEIPLGSGCGSSAAALLAGVFLANHFGQLRWLPRQVLDEACRREGHPDNVAACFCGGMTASTMVRSQPTPSGQSVTTATCGRDLTWPLLLALPRVGLATAEARALLPETYPREEAVANVQATALLVSAFALNRPELLTVGMQDQLHQPFRSSVCPLLPALLPLTGRHGICGVALSGAGPAVLLIASPGSLRDRIRLEIVRAGGKHLAEILDLGIGDPAMSSTAIR